MLRRMVLASQTRDQYVAVLEPKSDAHASSIPPLCCTRCFASSQSDARNTVVLGHKPALQGSTQWGHYNNEMNFPLNHAPGAGSQDWSLNLLICSPTWATEMKFVMNHAPGVGPITRSFDQQSITLPLYYGCPHITETMRDYCKFSLSCPTCCSMLT